MITKGEILPADILYFWGYPIKTISEHKGMAIGYSAGALIKLAEYHLLCIITLKYIDMFP